MYYLMLAEIQRLKFILISEDNKVLGVGPFDKLRTGSVSYLS